LIYLFTLCFHNTKIHFENKYSGEGERQQQERERQPHTCDEFASLSRSMNGEDVPLKEMKKSVLKAIQILLNRIPPKNYDLAGGLLVAYDALK